MGILKKIFGKQQMNYPAASRGVSTLNEMKNEYKGDGVGILFDWKAIGMGHNAWQLFCESCAPQNLSNNTVLMTDVERDACKVEIKALANRQHAFCIALPDASPEQVNYVQKAVLSNAAKFLLPETPFVPPALVGPWGSQIGSISSMGEFTLYDGDFLWVLLRAAKAKWICSISTNELNRFLRAIKSCRDHSDDEIAIYAHAIDAHRLDQALANFRSDYSRSLTHWSEDERPARQRECEELIARLKRSVHGKDDVEKVEPKDTKAPSYVVRQYIVKYCPRCRSEPPSIINANQRKRLQAGLCPICECKLVDHKEIGRFSS